jgi:hypothetical protein
LRAPQVSAETGQILEHPIAYADGHGKGMEATIGIDDRPLVRDEARTLLSDRKRSFRLSTF